jgi:hypothetical protein
MLQSGSKLPRVGATREEEEEEEEEDRCHYANFEVE